MMFWLAGCLSLPAHPQIERAETKKEQRTRGFFFGFPKLLCTYLRAVLHGTWYYPPQRFYVDIYHSTLAYVVQHHSLYSFWFSLLPVPVAVRPTYIEVTCILSSLKGFPSPDAPWSVRIYWEIQPTHTLLSCVFKNNKKATGVFGFLGPRPICPRQFVPNVLSLFIGGYWIRLLCNKWETCAGFGLLCHYRNTQPPPLPLGKFSFRYTSV